VTNVAESVGLSKDAGCGVAFALFGGDVVGWEGGVSSLLGQRQVVGKKEGDYVRALSVPRKNLPLLVTTALMRALRSSGDLAEGLQ